MPRRFSKVRIGALVSPIVHQAYTREMFSATLRQFGFRAEAILHDTPPRERAKLMSRFRAGELQFVSVVDLFNEGVDVPDIDMIVFMRVTHSRRIFVQQLGRGLRVSPDKDRVIVLDFVTDLRRVAEVIELDHAGQRKEGLNGLDLADRLYAFRITPLALSFESGCWTRPLCFCEKAIRNSRFLTSTTLNRHHRGALSEGPGCDTSAN